MFILFLLLHRLDTATTQVRDSLIFLKFGTTSLFNIFTLKLETNRFTIEKIPKMIRIANSEDPDQTTPLFPICLAVGGGGGGGEGGGGLGYFQIFMTGCVA